MSASSRRSLESRQAAVGPTLHSPLAGSRPIRSFVPKFFAPESRHSVHLAGDRCTVANGDNSWRLEPAFNQMQRILMPM